MLSFSDLNSIILPLFKYRGALSRPYTAFYMYIETMTSPRNYYIYIEVRREILQNHTGAHFSYQCFVDMGNRMQVKIA